MKKVMVLAGGNDQIALIEEIRKYFQQKVIIYLVDMSQNVRAKSYADVFLPISTMDKEAVLQAAKENKIDYILTACGDQPLSTMAYVSKGIDSYCYLSEEDVLRLTNKRFMKQKMLENKIPTARYIYINENWDGNLPDFSYPIVVKPVDSNGSKGVKKVFDRDHLSLSLNEAFQYSLSGDVIIEEFKAGEELSVDAYIENGIAKIMSVTSSKKIQENKTSFTIIQSIYPPTVSYKENKIQSIAQNIAEAWELKNTPLLIQMIVDEENDEYNVIEFSARMGGGSKYKLINILSGVDIMKVYVDVAFGGKPRIDVQKKWNNAIMSYIYCNPGIYKSLVGFDIAIKDNIIHDYFIYKPSGSIIKKSDTSSDRVAGFLVVGNSSKEVQDKLKKANALLKVLDAQGQDIMRHDLIY